MNYQVGYVYFSFLLQIFLELPKFIKLLNFSQPYYMFPYSPEPQVMSQSCRLWLLVHLPHALFVSQCVGNWLLPEKLDFLEIFLKSSAALWNLLAQRLNFLPKVENFDKVRKGLEDYRKWLPKITSNTFIILHLLLCFETFINANNFGPLTGTWEAWVIQLSAILVMLVSERVLNQKGPVELVSQKWYDKLVCTCQNSFYTTDAKTKRFYVFLYFVVLGMGTLMTLHKTVIVRFI